MFAGIMIVPPTWASANAKHPVRRCRNGGCDFAEDPSRDANSARLIWGETIDPGIVLVRAVRTRSGVDFADADVRIDQVRGKGGILHIAIVKDARRIRFDLVGHTIDAGPVRLLIDCPGLGAMRRASQLLGALEYLMRIGAFPASLTRMEPRTMRQVQLLRVHDARCAGVSARDIATILFGPEAVHGGWAGNSDYMKSRMRRLIKDAALMSGGRWRSLIASGS